jgi:hypothetical protein
MKWLGRILAHALFVFGLLVFVAMPDNKYTWMGEMDPSITTPPVREGNRTIFKAVLLISIVTTQAAIAVKATTKVERIVSIILSFAAASVWLLRF